MALTDTKTLCIVGFILIGALVYSEAVQCFSCNEMIHGKEKCGQSTTLTQADTTYIQNCTYGCKKNRVEINLGFAKSYTHSRECAGSGDAVGCTTGNLGPITGESCICDADLCNGATAGQFSVMVLAGTVVAAAVLLRI